MTKSMSPFSRLFDETIGFNRSLIDSLELQSYTSGVTYPPYNIVELDSNKYRVDLACAGFSEDELTIEKVENKLVINGSSKTESEVKYVHKGIAQRAFRRDFILNDNVEVEGAEYVNGILSVYLNKVIPEEKLPKKIEIKSSKKQLLID
jgi:molecular chaperone IbpA